MNQLYSTHRGDVRLASSVTGPTFNTSVEGSNIPALDATASRTADGKTIIIKAVNTDPKSPLITTITLQGATPAPRAELNTITTPSLTVSNNFSQPDAVSIQKRTIASRRSFVVTLPKHSVSVIVLRTR